MDEIIKYEREINSPIKGFILERLQDYFKTKTKNLEIVSLEKNRFQFLFEDELRDVVEKLQLTFSINNSYIKSILIQILSSPTKANEYDIKAYLDNLLLDIFQKEYSDETQKYVLRSYYSHYNSFPIAGEIHFNAEFKTRLKSLFHVPKNEPMTTQIICVDVEVNAVSFDHARTIAYNYSKDVIAGLSVLLDVGFNDISSRFDFFVRKIEEGLITERYRTGFIDPELKLLVKDNMNGLKSLEDSKDINSFFSGTISSTLISDKNHFDSEKTFVTEVTTKIGLEKAFSTHKIEKPKDSEVKYRDDIENFLHFPNNEIHIPKIIRAFFRSLNKLEPEKRQKVISFMRLYNLSCVLWETFPTAAVSYKIASVECLALLYGLSFSDFVRQYCSSKIDNKLLDYYYSLRSGHFHAGKFAFSEYSTSFIQEFDSLLQEKREDFFQITKTLRESIVNWIQKELIKN